MKLFGQTETWTQVYWTRERLLSGYRSIYQWLVPVLLRSYYLHPFDLDTQFGGNPQHVVLGGDSAGAQSITLHLTSFNGRPTNLFHATIAESQSFPTQLNVSQAEFQFTALTERVGCSNSDKIAALRCLRSLDVSTLQNANIKIPFPGRTQPPNFLYSPVIDGLLLPDFTIKLFEQGKFVKIPLAFGCVRFLECRTKWNWPHT